jgi:hypothetical protein
LFDQVLNGSVATEVFLGCQLEDGNSSGDKEVHTPADDMRQLGELFRVFIGRTADLLDQTSSAQSLQWLEDLAGRLTSDVPEARPIAIHVLQEMNRNIQDVSNDDQPCLVCLQKKRSVVLNPCRHCPVCAECFDKIRGQDLHSVCVLCRSPIFSYEEYLWQPSHGSPDSPPFFVPTLPEQVPVAPWWYVRGLPSKGLRESLKDVWAVGAGALGSARAQVASHLGQG